MSFPRFCSVVLERKHLVVLLERSSQAESSRRACVLCKTAKAELNRSHGAYILCYHVGMSKQAQFVQYTVRGVPREVDRVLRRRAAQRKLSLNRVIVEELSEAAVGRRKRAEFSDLVGKWTPDPAFDEILAAGRQIDLDKWK